ncbi:acyl-CoA N-acyltransferase [Mycena galopus ATCC 62051]|nr:acyl-CoA N-acyltransferase [Mycena galopus ATCC 62051]
MTLPFARAASLAPLFTISRCTPNDVPQLVECYLDAFAETTFTWFWPPTESMRTWLLRRFVRRFEDPTDQEFKIVENTSSQVVAFARWGVPSGMKGVAEGFRTYELAESLTGREAQSYGKQDMPEGANEEVFHEFFAGIKHMQAKWDAESKLDLGLVCTHPKYQGQGLAAALIKPVLDIADAEGITAYVEALPNAKAVYEHYGFKTVDTQEYDLTKAGREGQEVLSIMVREPKKSST